MQLVALLASLALAALLMGGGLAGIVALVIAVRLRRSLDELRRELDGAQLELARRRPLPDDISQASDPARPAPPPPAAAEPPQTDSRQRPETPHPVPRPPAADTSATRPGRRSPAIDRASGPPPTAVSTRRVMTVDWERWIGVRGAAAAGGTVLGLAALLLFQYTIEHDLITPPMRVALGVAVGVVALTLAEWLARRGQPFAANGLTGAGVVALYASFWAGHELYRLVAAVPAFAAMALTTAACGLLSRRRASLLVAVLGLAGGFATPLLVGSTTDSPVTLFGYILVLDAGLIWLARDRGWPLLAHLSVAGTALHQLLWLAAARPDQLLGTGAVVLGIFAIGFVAAGRGAGSLARWTSTGGVAVAFGLALLLAARAEPAAHFTPLGLLLLLLALLSCWLAHRLGGGVALAAAAASLGVLTAWLVSRSPAGGALWEVVAWVSAVALAVHLGWELERSSGGRSLAGAATVASGGLLLVLAAVSVESAGGTSLWPWFTGWAVAAALLVRQSSATDRSRLQVAAWAALGIALAAFAGGSVHSSAAPSPAVFLMVGVGVALAARLATALWRAAENRRAAEIGAAAAALALLLVPVLRPPEVAASSLPVLAYALLVGLMAAVAAAHLASSAWMAAAVGGTAIVHHVWCFRWLDDAAAPLSAALALMALACAAFNAWPLRARPAFDAAPGAWRVAALAGPAWFAALAWTWEARFTDAAIGLVPLGLAAVAAAAAAGTWALLAEPSPARGPALTWFWAVALSFVSIAIPLQLERQWITVGWALNGLALVALWRRIDRPGLKYFGAALLAAATVRLVANPAVLDYAERGAWPVLNWVLYTYLVPAAALLAARALLAPAERPRLRAWEVQRLGARPLVGLGCSLAAMVVVFVWINLAVADLFGTSPELTLSFQRMPARDLASSIAWGLYGLCLLGLGVRSASLTLRWASLLLFFATILKVFLHDLGELRDLYRVASLAGLAVSLIVVSLVYQRFVLRRPDAGDDAGP